MSDDRISIQARNLSKDFRYSGSETLFRLLRRRVLGGPWTVRTYRALSAVNLEVEEGQVVGIVGDNGAGKTTLLKTLAGIYRPSDGSVEIRGDVSFFPGLGVGMVGDLSLRDNLFLYGAICGLSRPRIQNVFDEVLEWAELTKFVNSPLRTLSTGMRSRFAFSIARYVESSNLFLDEAFTAGDAHFREKCNRHFEHTRTNGQTILVATHNLRFVREYCTKALWMSGGRNIGCGDVVEILKLYESANGNV